MKHTWTGRAASSPVWRAAIGAGCGAAAASLAFEATRTLSGQALYTVAGAVIGACLPLLSRRVRGVIRLSEVKLNIAAFSELTFVVDKEARLVAWRLYVEVSTRASTQPLDDAGLVREAMDSLYTLFRTTRETLKGARPSLKQPIGRYSVEHFAIRMLNHQLRPFLAKWHPLLREYEHAYPGEPESAWPLRAECRRELERVSAAVIEYALGFAELAGVNDAQQILAPPTPLPTLPMPPLG